MRQIYKDRMGIPLGLDAHVQCDLVGDRNPQDEPDYLATIVSFLVGELNDEQQERLAKELGFTKWEES